MDVLIDVVIAAAIVSSGFFVSNDVFVLTLSPFGSVVSLAVDVAFLDVEDVIGKIIVISAIISGVVFCKGVFLWCCFLLEVLLLLLLVKSSWLILLLPMV